LEPGKAYIDVYIYRRNQNNISGKTHKRLAIRVVSPSAESRPRAATNGRDRRRRPRTKLDIKPLGSWPDDHAALRRYSHAYRVRNVGRNTAYNVRVVDDRSIKVKVNRVRPVNVRLGPGKSRRFTVQYTGLKSLRKGLLRVKAQCDNCASDGSRRGFKIGPVRAKPRTGLQKFLQQGGGLGIIAALLLLAGGGAYALVRRKRSSTRRRHAARGPAPRRKPTPPRRPTPPRKKPGVKSLQFEDQPRQERQREEERHQPRTLLASSNVKTVHSNGRDHALITARVLEASSAPAVGAEIRFSAPKGGELMRTTGTTGDDGSLRTRWVPPRNQVGFFRVDVDCAGAEPSSQSVHLEAEREPPASIDLEAQPDSLPPDGESRATIMAVALGASGQPVEGARLDFYTDQSSATADVTRRHGRTDESGWTQTELEMPRDPEGEMVRVFASIDLYEGQRLDPPVKGETAVRVEQGGISGVVEDQAGRPVAQAEVELSNEWEGTTRRSVTGPKGSFAHGDARPGRCLIQAQAQGCEQTEESRAELELAPGENRRVRLVLRRAMKIELRPEKESLPADGKTRVNVEARLSDAAEQPVAKVALRISVEGEEPGEVEPAEAVTREDGGAEFTYRAGRTPGEYRLACRVPQYPEVEAETIITQDREHVVEVRLEHHHQGPKLRLYKTEEAAGRFSRLAATDFKRVEVVAGQGGEESFAGRVGRDGWKLAAMIAYLDCSPQTTFYWERAAHFKEQSRRMRDMANNLQQLLDRHEYLRSFAAGLGSFKTYYEVITLPFSGREGLADWLANSSLVSTLFGWGESLADMDEQRVRGSAKDLWREACREEIQLTRGLAEASEKLGEIWEELDWDRGREDLAVDLLPAGSLRDPRERSYLPQNPAGSYWAHLMALLDVQIEKTRLAAAAQGKDPLVDPSILEARSDLRELKAKWSRAEEEASRIEDLARTLAGMRKISDGS
jgi:hypothetical protein